MKITGLSPLIFLVICYRFSIIMLKFATRSYLLRRDAPLDGMKKHPGNEVAGLYDNRMKSERMLGARPQTFGDDSHNCKHISKIQTLAGLEGITL